MREAHLLRAVLGAGASRHSVPDLAGEQWADEAAQVLHGNQCLEDDGNC